MLADAPGPDKIAGKRGSLAALNAELSRVGRGSRTVRSGSGRWRHPARLVAFVVAPAARTHEMIGPLAQRLDPVFLPRHA